MDFDDSPEEAAFRVECREWLSHNADRRAPGGSEMWQTLRPRDEAADLAGLAVGKRWQLLKADAGFTGIQWPLEFNLCNLRFFSSEAMCRGRSLRWNVSVRRKPATQTASF